MLNPNQDARLVLRHRVLFGCVTASYLISHLVFCGLKSQGEARTTPHLTGCVLLFLCKLVRGFASALSGRLEYSLSAALGYSLVYGLHPVPSQCSPPSRCVPG